MTREQVRQKNFVNGMTLKIKPSLEWTHTAEAEAEVTRKAEELRREKQLNRRSNDVGVRISQVKIDVGDGRMEPSIIADGHEHLSSAAIAEAWEHVTQAGVTFWLNSATGEAQFENPRTGEIEQADAEEVDEELEIVKALRESDDVDEDGFLQGWVDVHASKLKLPM